MTKTFLAYDSHMYFGMHNHYVPNMKHHFSLDYTFPWSKSYNKFQLKSEILPFPWICCVKGLERRIWNSRINSASRNPTTIHLFTIILQESEATLVNSIHSFFPMIVLLILYQLITAICAHEAHWSSLPFVKMSLRVWRQNFLSFEKVWDEYNM